MSVYDSTCRFFRTEHGKTFFSAAVHTVSSEDPSVTDQNNTSIKYCIYNKRTYITRVYFDAFSNGTNYNVFNKNSPCLGRLA